MARNDVVELVTLPARRPRPPYHRSPAAFPTWTLSPSASRRCFTACDTITIPHSSHSRHTESDGGEHKSQHSRPKIITSDSYVTVMVPETTVARTRVIKNSQNPKWNAHFFIPWHTPLKTTTSSAPSSSAPLRSPPRKSLPENSYPGGFPLSGHPGRPETRLGDPGRAKVHAFREKPTVQAWGVRHTYFPLRKGSSLRLYQDAHVPDGVLPEIELDGRKVYRPESCWEDICYAISEAHHLIYIVGWSVFHKVKLIREPSRPLPRGGDLTLGDLLKYKSEEGVRVLLLVWDDKTSHDKFFFKTVTIPNLHCLFEFGMDNGYPLAQMGTYELVVIVVVALVVMVMVVGWYPLLIQAGMMGTHDEETRKFFKHSSVNCVLATRYASSKLSIIKQQVVGTLFTHHQKCVLVDTQAHGNNRKITAFIGGLDLCDGRYDTPEHRLFRDLNTVFKDDFHQPTFPAGTKAPRQPWHDLHCRIDGPAAYDVLINFEQRWRKATQWREFGLKRGLHIGMTML
ncbi:hypothetical protein GBA52_023193 [Prunus armeniaca]|nr:hypothetical protein GBA52_023193 [Prunus armeniaca]